MKYSVVRGLTQACPQLACHAHSGMATGGHDPVPKTARVSATDLGTPHEALTTAKACGLSAPLPEYRFRAVNLMLFPRSYCILPVLRQERHQAQRINKKKMYQRSCCNRSVKHEGICCTSGLIKLRGEQDVLASAQRQQPLEHLQQERDQDFRWVKFRGAQDILAGAHRQQPFEHLQQERNQNTRLVKLRGAQDILAGAQRQQALKHLQQKHTKSLMGHTQTMHLEHLQEGKCKMREAGANCICALMHKLFYMKASSLGFACKSKCVKSEPPFIFMSLEKMIKIKESDINGDKVKNKETKIAHI
eukprot:1161410-Pelagomonas_calceolata.AAC.10